MPSNSCTLSGVKLASCKESNAVASKTGAIVVLRGVLGLPVSLDDIPDAEQPLMTQTIVEAPAVRTLGEITVESDIKVE